MKTVETILKLNHVEITQFTHEVTCSKYFIIKAMKEYATEAIKADRERVVNIKIEQGDSFILPKYEKNCILNLPIELP